MLPSQDEVFQDMVLILRPKLQASFCLSWRIFVSIVCVDFRPLGFCGHGTAGEGGRHPQEEEAEGW